MSIYLVLRWSLRLGSLGLISQIQRHLKGKKTKNEKDMSASSSAAVRVAVTQAEPVWFDLPGAVTKTCALIQEAAANKAQLVAFPEVWIPGYPCWIWYAPLLLFPSA